jgi:outer membrane protein TolC
MVTLAALVLAGCHGVPTNAERQAREQASDVVRQYRPEGSRPTLPVLTADSSLSNFLSYALLNSPQIEGTYFDWLASIERITTARSLPDPQVTFQMDIQNIVTSVMPGLMMNFPGRGKLLAGANVASAESQAKYFAFQARVLETSFELKRAYYQLYFLEEKIRINQDTLRLLSDLETLARAQNEIGKVTLQDVLRAQIEQDRLKSELANLEDSRHSLMAAFKAALGLGVNVPTPPVPRGFESTPLDLTADTLLQTAFERSPRLQAMAAEIHTAEAAIVLAQRARRPDTSVGIMADAKASPTLYRPVATVSLPIWRDKIAAQIAEAQANQRAAEARLSAEQIKLAVEFAEKSFMYREASRNLALLREQLIPRQRQSLEVARSGYLAGQIDFFNLTDAEQTLLRFALAEVEARTQRELALAELSLVILGISPDGVPEVLSSPEKPSGSRSSPTAAEPGRTKPMK